MSQINKLYYPCLCEAVNCVIILGRIVGVLPIEIIYKEPHANGCRFQSSKRWSIYSYVLQILFAIYVVILYALRLSCGPHGSNKSEWYVMTFGYFMTDVDSIVSMLVGTITIKRSCLVLEKLSKIPGKMEEMRKLQQRMKLTLLSLLGFFSITFCSYIYVAWLRSNITDPTYLCSALDEAFGVIFRGVTTIFTMIQVAVVILYSLLVSSKYQHLADVTTTTLNNYIDATHRISSTTLKESMYCNSFDFVSELERLRRTFQQITHCLKEINQCIGVQMLTSISANLYTTIYYLYRYSTAADKSTTSNKNERWHYVLGLSNRIGKLLVYIVLGKMITSSSQQPMEAVQSAQLFNLPSKLQQHIKILMFQWYRRNGYLSACGVVNIGPWLLAPILGNVITYLLVALQFEKIGDEFLVDATENVETVF